MNPTAPGATALAFDGTLASDGTEAWDEAWDQVGHDGYDDSAFGVVIGAGQSPGHGPGHGPGHSRDREGARSRGDQLAELRAAGLVRHASDRVDTRVERVLPIASRLRPLFPGGVLRRGTTVAITAATAATTTTEDPPAESPSSVGPGSTSVLFGVLAEASAAGIWCAAVGLPRLGLVAAAEAGVAVDRLALVPYPGPDWASVVAALLDGVDIVVAATPGGVPAGVAQRLAARARQRGAVLVPVGRWPGADLTLSVAAGVWHGVGHGRGRLRGRELDVVAHGRGAAAHARRMHLWLPELTGVVPVLATPTPLRALPPLLDTPPVREATPRHEAATLREVATAREVAVWRAVARDAAPRDPNTAPDALPLAG